LPFFWILFSLFHAGCAKNNPQIAIAETTKDNLNLQAVRVSAPGADAAEPATAAAPDNGVYVVWVEHGTDKNADIFLQKMTVEGQSVGEKVRVNQEVGAARAWRGDPPTIAVGSDGKIFVSWTARAKAEGNKSDIVVSVSRDGGRSFDHPVKVNDEAEPAVHGMHSLAVDQNGVVYIAWLDERYLHQDSAKPKQETSITPKADSQDTSHAAHKHSEANREVYFSASKDGGKSFSANKKLAADVCPCCKTSIVAAEGGRVYVGWRQVLPDNFRHITVASSNDNGASFSPAIIVSDDRWQIPGCPVSGATMTVGTDKALKVFWFTAGEAGEPGFYLAESKDNGKTFSPRSLVNAGGAGGTSAVFVGKANQNHTVFETGGKIFAKTTPAPTEDSRKPQEISGGELPAAAFAENKTFVAFIKKEAEKRAVYLVVLDD
jgi:hypothetical protein